MPFQTIPILQNWNSLYIFAFTINGIIMIELPPILSDSLKVLDWTTLSESDIIYLNKLQDDYVYWNDIKYKKAPSGIDGVDLWAFLKKLRESKSINVYLPYRLSFSLTNKMMRLCHEFDMKFGGVWGSESIIPQTNRERYLVGSIMEEAISSSQMEGASTTRKVAKEMLRKKIAPKDKSQRMIYNNYQTINFLSSHIDKPLSIELICKIHSLITDQTLDNPEDSGRFRENNDVVVGNAITGEVVHTPPDYLEIVKAMQWLVRFANTNDARYFIHPVIKAVIVHFFISYIHPFVDGNGRTARALFHWYMLKEGYWLTEYLSISRIIYQSKASYEKAFLKVEADNNDMGYFITYHLDALNKSFEDLKKYISKKTAEQKDMSRLLRIGNINQRQAEIIYMFLENEKLVLTVKDVTARLLVSPTTAKHDIQGLVNKGILSEISFNKQKRGYIQGPSFSSAIDKVN